MFNLGFSYQEQDKQRKKKARYYVCTNCFKHYKKRECPTCSVDEGQFVPVNKKLDHLIKRGNIYMFKDGCDPCSDVSYMFTIHSTGFAGRYSPTIECFGGIEIKSLNKDFPLSCFADGFLSFRSFDTGLFVQYLQSGKLVYIGKE